MVGFRNVAVYEYQSLNLDIVQAIVEEHLSDFTQFTEQVLATDGFRADDEWLRACIQSKGVRRK